MREIPKLNQIIVGHVDPHSVSFYYVFPRGDLSVVSATCYPIVHARVSLALRKLQCCLGDIGVIVITIDTVQPRNTRVTIKSFISVLKLDREEQHAQQYTMSWS